MSERAPKSPPSNPSASPADTSVTSEVLDRWIARAREVQRQAHAPYSSFHVGALLVDEAGEVYAGCNVENVSFGATICAERNALGAAVAAGARRFRALVVVADSDAWTYPCGICRQSLLEFGEALDVFCVRADGAVTQTTLAELLPHAFAPRMLAR